MEQAWDGEISVLVTMKGMSIEKDRDKLTRIIGEALRKHYGKDKVYAVEVQFVEGEWGEPV